MKWEKPKNIDDEFVLIAYIKESSISPFVAYDVAKYGSIEINMEDLLYKKYFKIIQGKLDKLFLFGWFDADLKFITPTILKYCIIEKDTNDIRHHYNVLTKAAKLFDIGHYNPFDEENLILQCDFETLEDFKKHIQTNYGLVLNFKSNITKQGLVLHTCNLLCNI